MNIGTRHVGASVLMRGMGCAESSSGRGSMHAGGGGGSYDDAAAGSGRSRVDFQRSSRH